MENNLQTSDEFIEKVMEFYDTMQIRHSNMLIGPSGSGKTTIINTIAQALEKL